MKQRRNSMLARRVTAWRGNIGAARISASRSDENQRKA